MTSDPRPPLFGGAERVQSFQEAAPAPPLSPFPGAVPQPPDESEAVPSDWQPDPVNVPPQSMRPAPHQEAVSGGEAPATRRARRAAELMEPDPAASQLPLTGWRRAVRTMTFGLASPSPDPRVVEWHADRAAVNANFPRLLTAMVANPKGGRGKTPLSLLLAAAFGELRGGGVCAWDNNETLGTMGIRTEVGPYRTTVVDLVDDLDRFEHVRARRGDLGQYTHHQAAGHFDALISDEDPTRMAMVDREQFERIHELLGRFYNIIMIDTGNNPKAANFVAALAASDVLVIPIQWTRDSVVTAGRLVDQLREAGREDLVASAVTVVSDKGQSLKASPEQVASWREWFTDTTGSIINVPFDPHIAEDGVLRWDALQEGTQRALVRVAAAISHAFSHRVSQTGVRQ